MPKYRHRLTQLIFAIASLSCLNCEKTHERAADVASAAAGSGSSLDADGGDAGRAPAADSGVADGSDAVDSGAQIRPDGGEPTPPLTEYKLCDRSDQIRYGLWSGAGGAVEPGYFFDHPYGHQFLYIDGRCDFAFTQYKDPPGTVVRGHLDEQAAEALEHLLALAELPAGRHLDQQNCADGGTTWIATARFYGECACDCDPGTPAYLTRALNTIEETFAMLRARAAAASGEVEIIALAHDPLFTPRNVPDWPFSWPVADIVNESLLDMSEPLRMRTLEGVDAQTARTLRSEALGADRAGRAFVQSGSMRYQLFIRDRLDPQLAAKIKRFNKEADRR